MKPETPEALVFAGIVASVFGFVSFLGNATIVGIVLAVIAALLVFGGMILAWIN